MNIIRGRRIRIAGFILIQIVLYIIFLSLDIQNKNYQLSNIIKFIVIVLCLCYTWLNQKNVKQGQYFCLIAAMFFTVTADMFILLLDLYLAGVISFCIVQQLYSLRLMLLGNHIKGNFKLVRCLILEFCIRLVLAAILCLTMNFMDIQMDGLLIVTIFYFTSFLANIVKGIMLVISSPKNGAILCFVIGMILFLLCDINVGIFNLSGYITVSEDLHEVLYSVSAILMWTFYAPAQVLIALSGNLYSKNE